MLELNLVEKVAIWSLPVLFAITLHEVAHGWVASKRGDPTARDLGRLTLNPISHIDPVGTVVVPVVMLLLGGFIFGWAKPVPVDPRRLRHPRFDMALVALAGPMANLLMALGWALVAKVALIYHPELGGAALPLVLAGAAGVLINVLLLVLNLLPLPPLDGGRVLSSALPPAAARGLARVEPYGFLILVALLATGALSWLLTPMVRGVIGLIASLGGIPMDAFSLL